MVTSSPPPRLPGDFDRAWSSSGVENSSKTHSRSSTLWTAPSPSQIFSNSSPRLPTLSGILDTSICALSDSPAPHHRSDNSAYYTALWGSPISSEAIPQRHLHQRNFSIITADSSPSRVTIPNKSRGLSSRQDQFYIDRVRADALVGDFGTQRNSTVRIASPLVQQSTRYGFTQDWLINSNSGSNNIERGNWWSDESDPSEKGSLDTPEVLGKPNPEEARLQLRGWTERVEASSRSNNNLMRGCKERETSNTNWPSDHSIFQKRSTNFRKYDDLELLDQHANSIFLTKMLTSDSTDLKLPTEAVMKAKMQNVEKALPPTPPPDQIGSGGQKVNVDLSLPSPPLATFQPLSSGQSSFQRPRKRVTWRKKTCIIALPLCDALDEKTNKKVYLTPQDVEDRLLMWRSRGFDTKGFSLTSHFGGFVDNLSEGQSRVIFPDVDESEKISVRGAYRVSIPNRQEWEDYVRRLKEDKLRALGVSFGEQEPSSMDSPAVPSMSRHASSQSPVLPISPQLAASPAVSLHGNQSLNLFPPHFAPSMNLGPQMISHLITGSQQKGTQAVTHISNSSMGFPSFEHGPLGFQLSQAQSPFSGTWSPKHYLNSQSNSRATSPATSGHMQSLGNVLPPSLLLAHNYGKQGVNHAPQGDIPPTFHQQAQVQSQILQQQQQHQHQMMQQPCSIQSYSNPRNKAEETVYNSQPDIVNPIPRGHRQNLSETLQKELDEAEFHPEKSKIPTTRQGERILELTVEERLENAEEPPVLPNILQSTVRGSNNDDSDLDTNPSLSGTPKPQEHKGELISRQHSSKSSISRLNVNAPEFVFEPKKSFTSEVFAFLGNQPPSASLTPDDAPISSRNDHSNYTSKESNINSTLSVAAPSFAPANAPKTTVPSRAFSFSTKIHSFPPEASNSQKSSENNSFRDTAAQSKMASVNRIFAGISYSEIIKPVKGSKAIPIISPKALPENLEHDVDGQEDESGRITQPDGRQKRMRHNNDNGNEVPLFHEIPSVSEKIDSLISVGTLDSKTGLGEAIAESNAEIRTKDVIGNVAFSDVSSLTGDIEAIDADGKPWEPYSFQDVEDAVIFDAARSSLPPLGNMLGELNFDVNNSINVSQQLIGSAIRDVEKDSLPAATEIIRNLPLKALSSSDVGSTSNVSLSPLGKVSSACSRSASQSSASTSHQNNFVPNSIKDVQRGETDALGIVAETDSALIDGVAYLPSYHEIDAVMKHLNEDDSDLGVERNLSPWKHKSPILTPLARFHNPQAGQLLQMPQMRSDAPSPSPNRLRQPFQYLPESDPESPPAAEVEMIARNARFSPSYRPSKESLVNTSTVHRLNSPDDIPVSDWDDVISSSEETKLRARTGFFNHRIDNLVGDVVQQRLNPLEKALASIQNSLATLSYKVVDGRNRRSFSGDIENSDADDEDDDLDESESRIKSPLRDRTYEKLKALLTETSLVRQQSAFSTEVSEIKEAVKELKGSIQRPSQSSNDIKSAVEEAVARQMRGKSGPIVSSHESATVEKLQLQITGLESMLKIADGRADDELKARRATEDALADSQRLLRMAMQEAAEQRESAEETERSLSAFHDERQHVLRRTAMLEGAQESLLKTVSDLTENNVALEETLAEYRLSSSQWRDEVEDAKTENKDLQRTINALKIEIEDSIRGRQTLRTKFDRLQEDMTLASRDIARDQSRWRKVEEENKARIELMNTKLDSESGTRERLEAEIMILLKQERENTTIRHNFEQCQQVISRQEELLDSLRSEKVALQNDAARYERELHDVRETATMEVERTRTSAELDIETANNQINIVSSDLQRVIARLQNQLDEAIVDSSAAKTRYEAMLEEASESRKTALREAAEAREAALQEHYRFHERTLEESKAQHSRLLNNALEDKQRLEMHLNSRLALADEKVLHLQDKASHLEEKLEITKSAARAATQAAQSKISLSPSGTRASIPLACGSDIPEKISPQALRESIMVLQEQLQDREGHIEQLEQEASRFDQDAPAKLKEREIEIVWLRELLGVRIDDLEDIITTLSKPSYNREAIKDAAIRLKANLQMEQQEKERVLAGGHTFPSLASISDLASSPRAFPLAAAAAWGNWRKARDASFGSLSGIANGNVDQTPSRSSPSTRGFLSGLLTPPSVTRQTSLPKQKVNSSRQGSSTTKPSSGIFTTPRQGLSLQDENRPLRAYNRPETPPLMRKASYDSDAESPEFVDTDGEDNNMDGYIRKEDISRAQPFGPSVEEFSGQE